MLRQIDPETQVEIDGDYLDFEMGKGNFSTGLPDELSPAAQRITGMIGDMMADNAQLESALKEIPWTLAEAAAYLRENAPDHIFGLSFYGIAYVGLPANVRLPEAETDCVVRVLTDGATNQPAQEYRASDWQTACAKVLSALFPNPQAA